MNNRRGNRGKRQQVVTAIVLVAIGLAIILVVPTAYEGPLLLYINEQHAIRLVDAIGLIIAISAWVYLGLLMREWAIRSLYLSVFGCALIFRNRLYATDVLSLVISLTLMAAGVTLFLVGRKILGKSHTTLPEARQLVTHGIYSKIRHPLYVGLQLAYWGLSLWLASPVGAFLSLLLILPLHMWRARAEERVLEERFGDEYIQYKAHTLF